MKYEPPEIEHLIEMLETLAYLGGVVMSTSDLSVEEIQSAGEEGRLYVHPNGFGYVRVPFPENSEKAS